MLFRSEEFRTCGKKCTIFAANSLWLSAGPVCVMDPQTVQADADRRIKPFRSPKKAFVKALQKWQDAAPSDQAMKRRGSFLSSRGAKTKTTVNTGPALQPPPRLVVPGEPKMTMSATVYSRELNRIITASGMPRKMVATLVGVSLVLIGNVVVLARPSTVARLKGLVSKHP